MKTTLELFSSYKIPESTTPHRNYREELVSLFVEGINAERWGTRFRPISKKVVAIRLNRNPMLAKNDGEVAYLLKQCQEKNSYSKFFWATQMSYAQPVAS